jgi:hypothetical protein
MSVYKPFISSDLVVVPFKVNKNFSFEGTASIDSNNIGRYLGRNITSSLYVSGSNPTGQTFPQDEKLIYNSVKTLYYSNFLTSPNGSPTNTASFETDGTITGEDYTPSYYNYLSSTLNPNRYFPTGSNTTVGVISIPSNIFGEYIKPGSLNINLTNPSASTIVITDDTEGNLMSGSTKVGDIIYEHGMVITTNNTINNAITSNFVTSEGCDCIKLNFPPSTSSFQVVPSNYSGPDGRPNYTNISVIPLYSIPIYISYNAPSGSWNVRASSFNTLLAYLPTTSSCPFGDYTTVSGTGFPRVFNISQCDSVKYNMDLSFDSTITIHESQYKCTIRENEFNFSLNPSIISQSSNGSVYDFTTGSYFQPYITTVGLYNNNKELLAVAKLSQPLICSNTTDTSVIINLDF